MKYLSFVLGLALTLAGTSFVVKSVHATPTMYGLIVLACGLVMLRVSFRSK